MTPALQPDAAQLEEAEREADRIAAIVRALVRSGLLSMGYGRMRADVRVGGGRIRSELVNLQGREPARAKRKTP